MYTHTYSTCVHDAHRISQNISLRGRGACPLYIHINQNQRLHPSIQSTGYNAPQARPQDAALTDRRFLCRKEVKCGSRSGEQQAAGQVEVKVEVRVEGQMKGGGQVCLTGSGLAQGPGTGGAVDGLTGRLDVSLDLREKTGRWSASSRRTRPPVRLLVCLPACLSVNDFLP